MAASSSGEPAAAAKTKAKCPADLVHAHFDDSGRVGAPQDGTATPTADWERVIEKKKEKLGDGAPDVFDFYERGVGLRIHRSEHVISSGFEPQRHTLFIHGRPTQVQPEPVVGSNTEPLAGPSGSNSLSVLPLGASDCESPPVRRASRLRRHQTRL